MKIPAFFTKLFSDHFRWLAVGTVILVFALGYVLLVAGKIQTIQETGFVVRKNVQTELSTQKQYLQALEAAIQHYQTVLLADQLAAIDQFIPSSADFPGLLLTLKNLASAANLNLDTISISEIGQQAEAGQSANANQTAATSPATARAATVSGVNLQVQDANITVSGGQEYSAFKSFIALIESSRRLLDVVSLGFSFGGENEKQSGSGSYTLHVRTYYLPRAR